MKRPVAQIGLGPLGQRMVHDLVTRELAQVVAAVDPDPALVGRDLSEIVPQAPPGTRIVSTPEEVADWRNVRCAMVTTCSDLEFCMDTFRSVLGHGSSVVSTCEELSWPWLRHPVLAQELDELAIKNGARILGTGINPGFLMDALPVALATASGSIEQVSIERIQDAAPRRLPFQRKIGVGLDEAEFARRVHQGSLRHVGLGESLHFVAHYLGLRLERWEESIAPVLAETPHASGLGQVLPGQARGVQQVARGWIGEVSPIELTFRAAIDEPDPRDRIHIRGTPPLDLVLRGGVHGDIATTAIAVNMVRPLLEAPAGLHTMATVPLQGCTPTRNS